MVRAGALACDRDAGGSGVRLAHLAANRPTAAHVGAYPANSGVRAFPN
jgi:hypothetical protein